jgi:hypothetical protein
VAASFDGDPAETAKARSFDPDFLGDGPFLSYSGTGVRTNQIAWVAETDLEWTRYGHWGSASPVASGHGAWVAGFQTPLAAIPVTGSARYAGKVSAIYSELPDCNCFAYAKVSGDVTMTADFAARSVSGTMTNLMVTSERSASGTMNDIAFAAAFASGRNQFTGTTSLASAGSGPWALSAGASGAITGHFYGPGAQEAGAAWTLSDATRRVIGAFGASRQ